MPASKTIFMRLSKQANTYIDKQTNTILNNKNIYKYKICHNNELEIYLRGFKFIWDKNVKCLSGDTLSEISSNDWWHYKQKYANPPWHWETSVCFHNFYIGLL